jgi:lipopolysaccharide export system protein LptA
MRRWSTRTRKGFWSALLVALAVLSAAPGALIADPPPAAKAPEKIEQKIAEPLDVAADRLELDVEARTAVLSGNVRLSKGAMSVSCPRVEARFDDAQQIVWAKGTGGVIAETRGARAEAPEVELDLGKQLVDLRGGVRIARGAGWIKADRATIHMGTGKISMEDVKGSLPIGEGKLGEPKSKPGP